jgi:hypothetical protein
MVYGIVGLMKFAFKCPETPDNQIDQQSFDALPTQGAFLERIHRIYAQTWMLYAKVIV